jgi:hypothetical protein
VVGVFCAPLCAPKFTRQALGTKIAYHATLAEDQSRKSAGVAQCGMSEMQKVFRLQSYAASILSVSNVQLAESDLHPL